MKYIQVQNVSKKFFQGHCPDDVILNNLNMTVEHGKIYILIGASGCGKTTLLDCIMGMKKIDGGTIKIFNKKMEFGGIFKFSKLIGCMPQDTSLSHRLSVLETLQFFANLQLVSKNLFEARYRMISKLLELPPSDSLIMNLSGGQQRRVSLAVTILHDPKLLILDEPTSGLDFQLREKIWSYFVEQSRNRKVSILMTSHCLNEAAKADRCGYLQNGVLIAEGPPQMILRDLGVETMEEAFYELRVNNRKCIDFPQSEDSEDESDVVFGTKKLARTRVIKALFMKEFHRIKRQPFEIFMILLMAVAIIAIAHFVIGRFPHDIKLAVIESKLPLDELQLKFLNHIKGVQKIVYKSDAKALEAFNSGQVFGTLALSSNFTSSLLMKDEDNPFECVEVNMDYSKYPYVLIMKNKLIKAFKAFLSEISSNYEVNSMLLMQPLKFDDSTEETLSNGKFLAQLLYTTVLTPFLLNLHNSLLVISDFRSEGVWNRTLLNGVTASEIVLAILIQCCIYSAIYALQMVAFIAYWTGVNDLLVFSLTFGIIFDSAVTGFMLGFLSSIAYDTFIHASSFGLAVNVTGFLLTGTIWPIEGMTDWMQALAYLFPTTLPSLLMSDLIQKNLGLLSQTFTFRTVTVILGWKVVIFLAMYVLLKRKSFYEYDKIKLAM